MEGFKFPIRNEALDNKYEGDILKLKAICVNSLVYLDSSGFGVYTFENEKDERLKVQGVFPTALIVGQTYDLDGKIIFYQGIKELKAKTAIPCKPSNKKGIIAYLKTLYGLKNKAELIYEVFGQESINVLIKEPLNVAKSITGIGKKSVVKWREQLLELEENQEAYVKLLGYGISPKNTAKLLKKYGENIVTMIERNPYFLIKEIKGFGFLTCDRIAMETGIKPNDTNRINAGIIFALQNGSMEGHCYLPKDLLITNVMELLDIKLNINEMNNIYSANKEKENVKTIKYGHEYEVNIDELIIKISNYNKAKSKRARENERYYVYSIEECDVANQINSLITDRHIVYENEKAYLNDLYYAEVGFAKKILKLAKYKSKYSRAQIETILDEICDELGCELEDQQRNACIEFNMSDSGVYILRGSAGTGKTFTLRLILKVAERLDEENKSILPVAPTGKASKVASQSIGMKCSTIHRALGYNPITEFNKDEHDQFEQKVIVCDEGSMIDIELGFAFVKAIKKGSKFIIMGDTNQLPSIGAGNVLHDLIESGILKVVTLNVIKRQGSLSGIIKNANNVIRSKMIYTESATKDFFILEAQGINVVKNTTLASIRRLLTYPGYTLEDIQILLPQRTGALGVNIFNYLIQQEFNKTTSIEQIFKEKFEVPINDRGDIKEIQVYFKESDRVMHVKNNYEMTMYEKDYKGNFKPISKGITNGECGIIESIVKIPKKGYKVTVKYDDFYAIYEEGIDELELCYATTIHKSQGSAWKAILLPVVPQHTHMWSNNLLYTGITRAREFVGIIGSNTTIATAINTHKVVERYTTLIDRLVA